MEKADAGFYHRLYGLKKTRAVYRERDGIDYVLMLLMTAGVIYLSYGPGSTMALLGLVLCGLMLIAFPLRHGFVLSVPYIVKRPQDVLFMIVHRAMNLRPAYFISVALMLAQLVIIHWTPSLPHKVELMRKTGFFLFYTHFFILTVYRTIILVAHLRKRELVREVLMQTMWKKQLGRQPNITIEIFHAYFTGLLTHLILLAPWYLVIFYVDFSLVLAPLVCLINLVIQFRYFMTVNSWFYRDHWLGHNSELDFLYLHGSHHDAIPSGLIGVAGNGFLEGFMRHAMGSPVSFYNPIVAFISNTSEVITDINGHQFIPGIFPVQTKEYMQLTQHGTHHYGRMEPYGFAMKVDHDDIPDELKKKYSRFPDSIKNSASLDEQLTDFEWDNPTHRSVVALFDKYSDPAP